MAGTKFSGFTTGATTANTKIVGYDSGASTNNQYTLAQLAAGISPSITFPDTIFTASPTETVPTGQLITCVDELTIKTPNGPFVVTTGDAGFGDLRLRAGGYGGSTAGSQPGLSFGASTNMIKTYTANSANVAIGPPAAYVSINKAGYFFQYMEAGLEVGAPSATTNALKLVGGSDANTSTALVVQNNSGTETFSVRDDGLVTVAVEATIPKRKFEITSAQPPTNLSADGDIVYFGTGTTVLGKLYYFDGTDWLGTDASAGVGAGALGLLGIALGTTPATDGMLIRGMVTLEHDPGTIGNTLYMAPAGALGLITDTIPAVSGETVRVVGYCMDSTNYQIWFNPSSTTIELA